MISVAPGSELRQMYARESEAIRRRFTSSGDGRACIAERSALMDSVIAELFATCIEGDTPQTCVVALGGYGRNTLFPQSDVDVMFLCANEAEEARQKAAVATVSRELWDMRVRVSPFTRTLEECGRPHPDNLEFTIALLDARLVCGKRELFAELQANVVPRALQRERSALVRDLVALTRQRHKKFSNTVFHLEPNIKDGPGGLRDLNVVHWLRIIARHAVHAAAPDAGEDVSAAAFDFLAATRCFLHYRNGRDDNMLSYERQAEGADESIGVRPKAMLRSADWMRVFFRSAREIDRRLTQLIEDVPVASSTLYSRFEQWRSRLSTAEYSVVNGRVLLKQPSAMQDLSAVLALYQFISRHDLKLSAEAERQVRRVTATLHDVAGMKAWEGLRQILVHSAAACALRSMHELGVLSAVLPEFHAIDSLVIGDFYHRYTVDEHSLTAIEVLHKLRGATDASAKRFQEILSELEQPDLLFLSLLLHDVGKATLGDHHVQGSLTACDRVCARFELTAEDRDTLRFLIANHLEMSATLMRRDIFDPRTLNTFGEKVGTLERLKMLCLMTYADVSAVSPETLTPWKAESLWQLYAASANHLQRTVDSHRLASSKDQDALLQKVAAAAKLDLARVTQFVYGMPRRYVLLHSPQEIAEHCRYAQLLTDFRVQLKLRANSRGFELTVITPDRHKLFAALTGLLAAWRMNIVKADAFANAAGTVVDTFQFTDPFGTLTLNPSEADRLEREIRDVLSREITSDTLRWLDSRVRTKTYSPPKVQVPTRIWFDDASSTHSTIMEIVTRDRPGLLYDIGSALAESSCEIEVALIDTEGQKAIDVLYLRRNGKKLTQPEQHELRALLLSRI